MEKAEIIRLIIGAGTIVLSIAGIALGRWLAYRTKL